MFDESIDNACVVCASYLKILALIIKRHHGIVYSPFVRKLDLCNFLRMEHCLVSAVTSLKNVYNS